MRVMVVGGGAREHALIWKLYSSPLVNAVYCAPGNAGISYVARTDPVSVDDMRGLLRVATTNGIELVVVGPEGPLAAGIVDAFRDAGFRIFGPTSNAARIESSKIWAKDLMMRYGIPTARWARAEHGDEARSAVRTLGLPVVIKADGLAAGKGVVICQSVEQADQVIDDFMSGSAHGAAGQRLVIEEYLEGTELSVFAICDGRHVVPLMAARDYKPLLNGDEGPKHGGMGGYTRPAYATPELLAEVQRTILEPTVKAMAEESSPFLGILYAGLMLTRDGPKALEFNCRWGDPEAELVLPLLKSDLCELMIACIDGRLEQTTIEWNDGVSCGVVLAAEGYPDNPVKGAKITGLDELDDGVLAFHGATRALQTPEPRRGFLRRGTPRTTEEDVGLVTDGGRVLTVVATGANLAEARAKVYANVERIKFDGVHYRHDIGAVDPNPTQVQAADFVRTLTPPPSIESPLDTQRPAVTPVAWSAEAQALEPTPGEPPIDERATPGEYTIPSAPAPNPATEEPPPAIVASSEPGVLPQPTPSLQLASGGLPGGNLVAVIMGSESDRPVMDETAKALTALGIAHEVHVMSAHRTPERVRQFARTAEARGLRVIIAGAGGAAHLPGVIAAQCTLPVIGVPILGSSMMGLDSLLSIVQMPGGVPVATVAVGTAGARNAAYLAAAMLGIADDGIRNRYKHFRQQQSGGELA